MKKFLLGLAAGLLFASQAHAIVIKFDDLDAGGKLSGIAKYNPYDSFTWGTKWFLGVTSVNGYGNAAHSGTQFVTNGFGVDKLDITSTEAFDFLGAWFATPNTNGSKASWIKIEAYNSANLLIGSTGNVGIGAAYARVAANFTDVTRLSITRDKGWFVMDDFSFTKASMVPEPGSMLLLGLGLAALGLSRRKARAS